MLLSQDPNLLVQKLSNFSFKNKLMNGAMNVQQRSAVSASNYLLDRWMSLPGSGGTPARTYSRSTSELSSSPYWRGPRLIHQQTAVATSSPPRILQMIEDVRTLAGKTCTLSFWANRSSTAITVTPVLRQYFGTGGSASVDTQMPSISLDAGITQFRYSTTVTLPSIQDKTIATDGTACLALRLLLPLNTTFNFSLTGVQLEEGSVATSFEFLPPSIEIELCRRYFQRVRYGFSGLVSSGVFYVGRTIAPVAMRTSPTATLFDVGTSGFPTTPSSPTLSGQSDSHGYDVIEITESRGATVNTYASFSTLAQLDAEFAEV